MGRRNATNIASAVGDVVYIVSRLPWWGALLMGIVFYVLFADVLAGFIEAQIATQGSSKYYWLTQARFGHLVDVCEWVGTACFIAGVIFAIRNYLTSNLASRSERSLVTMVSKFIGRYLS